MKSVAAISLGCDKNRVDTERMLYRITRGGYGISDVSDAEIIIVNTCAFIESARQESIDTILSCAEYKKSGKCERLIVTGCLPQKYRAELEKELPEVDAFLGVNDYDGILEVIDGSVDNATESADFNEKFEALENCGRLLTTYPHIAYLKIADGCDNKCTFCAIPSIRGPYRSRPVADVVKEAAGLVNDGVSELVLVAQDVTRYGEDKNSSLIELLDELSKLDVKRLRLLYCYPERVTDELINVIATNDKIAKYIDIPVQHYSDKILKLMNRRTTGAHIESLIAGLHEKGIAVRTTLMVGFPGETDDDFDALCGFVKRARPEYAGVFAYSKEDGTAAARLKDQVKKSVKRARANALGAICTEATREFNAGIVGRTIEVIYEDIDYDKNLFVGRADFQAPDVDGRVYFKAAQADVGNYYKVKITDSDDYDLYGEVIDEFTE
ncbi:MAG: 30S ribosomal protein S12 methylthiotransferase RimO [Clostridiales bacterium]|nr:30S ribosomal protein S12 methylthiotransferase RimO [Clostridiales bacterium]